MKGLYIARKDLRLGRYGMTPGCRGCIAANRGEIGVNHDDRCRLRIEEEMQRKEPERYEKVLERLVRYMTDPEESKTTQVSEPAREAAKKQRNE